MGTAFSPPLKTMKFVLLLATIGSAAAAKHCKEDEVEKKLCPNFYGLLGFDSLEQQGGLCEVVDAAGTVVMDGTQAATESFCYSMDEDKDVAIPLGMEKCDVACMPIIKEDHTKYGDTKNHPTNIEASANNCIQETLETYRRTQIMDVLKDKTLCASYLKQTQAAHSAECSTYAKCTAIQSGLSTTKAEIDVEVAAETDKTSACFGNSFNKLFQRCKKRLTMSDSPTEDSSAGAVECGDAWLKQSVKADTTYCTDFKTAQTNWKTNCENALKAQMLNLHMKLRTMQSKK
jgi:hypothetical protein